jgi:CheY-like chemotaxis protein
MRIEVEDSGPGIPEAFKGRVFEKFAQADGSTTRRHEGSGLGLSIARKLTEAMGGTIGFSTVAGEGTIFHLDLPRISAASMPPTENAGPSAGAAPASALTTGGATVVGTSIALPRILYVEDDEDLISVIRATLAGRAEIVHARGLREAERLLRAERFELIILDQALPDGNGFTLVEQIPALTGRAIPVVVLSVTDIPPDMHGKVATVLIKSQASASHVATTILSYLPAPGPSNIPAPLSAECAPASTSFAS